MSDPAPINIIINLGDLAEWNLWRWFLLALTFAAAAGVCTAAGSIGQDLAAAAARSLRRRLRR